MIFIVRIYSFVIRLAIGLALAGQLRGCTLAMMGKAAEKTKRGMISYSKFIKILTR